MKKNLLVFVLLAGMMPALAETIDGTVVDGQAVPLSYVTISMIGADSSLVTGAISDEKITELVKKHFDLRPAAIIRDLDLRRPIYAKTAAYGHFGREDKDFLWEKTDKAEALKKYL